MCYTAGLLRSILWAWTSVYKTRHAGGQPVRNLYNITMLHQWQANTACKFRWNTCGLHTETHVGYILKYHNTIARIWQKPNLFHRDCSGRRRFACIGCPDYILLWSLRTETCRCFQLGLHTQARVYFHVAIWSNFRYGGYRLCNKSLYILGETRLAPY